MLAKQWTLLGILGSFLSVVLGAFGGHLLKDLLSPKAFSVYLIGVQYQITHSLALLALGIWAGQNPTLNTRLTGWAFSFGILTFSGSLYALALTDQKLLGLLTPLGGLSFLVGWIGFAFIVWKA